MTDNEIIKCLRHCRAGDCENCKALNVCDATFSFHKEALDLIKHQKSEIERFVAPKKPISFKRTEHDLETGVCPYSQYDCENIRPYNHEYEYTAYKCPACNKLVSDGTPEYCCHCGQALDWSDE